MINLALSLLGHALEIYFIYLIPIIILFKKFDYVELILEIIS